MSWNGKPRTFPATRTGHRYVLSLRVWLILVVLAILGVTGIVEGGLGAFIYHSTGEAGSHAGGQVNEQQIAAISRVIGTDAARWHQSEWQHRATVVLDALGVDLALFGGKQGRLVFATPGARQLLDTGILTLTRQAATEPVPAAAMSPLLFARLTITGPAPRTMPPIGIAYVWFTRTSSLGAWFVLPVAGVLTLALTLGLVAWLLRRPVLRPLTAMSEAVDGIAGGDLEIHLPPSPVREIAEVTEALEGMSRALHDALARQSALEDERRLFVSASAHDLRTPLFILRAHLRGLQRGIAATPEKMQEYIDECMAKADALERLVADLFAFTRLEYLEQEPKRVPLELGALLHRTVGSAQPLAAAKHITMTVDGPAEPCPLLGDEHLLPRVVNNLLENAIRHTPGEGRIWVQWRSDGPMLSFAVADTGPGIAAQDLPHLFTPLYRGEPSRNRQTGGTGLGLAIARRILRAHGGDLTAANGPTGGAVFTASLPAAPATIDGTAHCSGSS
jgi:signal transduction histidine kinase